MIAGIALRGVLVVLAAYHLAIGALSVASPRTTSHVARIAYGLSLDESPQLAHAIRMLGLYALALGSLLTVAAGSPREHRAIIAVVAALQGARALVRIAHRGELRSVFHVTPTRNGVNVALLVIEAAILVACFPAR